MRASLVAFLSALLPLPLAAQRVWRPDDRVLVSAMSEVGALARDQRSLFALSAGAISIFDLATSRWQLPVTVEDGVPPFDPPAAAEYEPVLAQLWVGTHGGTVYRYRAVPFRVEIVTGVPGPISAIVALPALDDFVYVRGARDWFRIRRASFSPEVVPPGRVPAEIARSAASRTSLDASLNAFRAVLGSDPDRQRWPLTSFLADDRRESYWFGTRGGFVFRFDALRQSSDWLWYGSPSVGVPALAVTPRHVWFGADGRGPRYGVARATHDLQEWLLSDAVRGAPREAAIDMAATDHALHVATRNGVFTLANGAWTQHDVSGVVNVAATRAGAFVATRGAVIDLTAAARQTVVRAASIERVRLVRDSIWILAGNQLLRYQPGDTAWVQSDAPVVGRFIDVGAAGASTALLATDGLYLHDGSGWHGPHGALNAAGLGRLRQLSLTDSAVWVAADRGAARYSLRTSSWEFLRVPHDIPAGPVFQAVEAGSHVWLATPAGALRVKR